MNKKKSCKYLHLCHKSRRTEKNNLCHRGGGDECGYWRYMDSMNQDIFIKDEGSDHRADE